MKKFLIIFFILISTNSYSLEFKGKFIQGSFILGKTKNATPCKIHSNNFKILSNTFISNIMNENSNLKIKECSS